jgi:lipid-A-disaccharide synthase
MHYFLIAGEASGDLHGSRLIDELRAQDPQCVVTFIGGDKMAAASGQEPLIHCRDMAYMGFSEVIRNLSKVRANLSRAREALKMAHPDCLILIDYPSFNLKVAATAAKACIPVYYYISPKIWAWKKWRIKDIRRLVRRVFSILPFEPEYYRANGASAVYVGNPSLEEVDLRLRNQSGREAFLAMHKLRDRPLVALMPGSRQGEIHNNLPVMNLALNQFPQYRGIIIGTPDISDRFYRENGAGNLPILRPESAVDVLVHCRAALVTSGTATLETALTGIPQVALYRSNGAKITYDIMSKVLDIKYVTLPNLIADLPIIPEQLIHLCTPALVAEKLGPLLREDTPEREAQLEGYRTMREKLGTRKAAATTAAAIISDMRRL